MMSKATEFQVISWYTNNIPVQKKYCDVNVLIIINIHLLF